jgi:hypothetical protein
MMLPCVCVENETEGHLGQTVERVRANCDSWTPTFWILQAGQQDPARAAGDVQHQAIRLARQANVEIKPKRDVVAHKIVDVAIIKD